MSCVLYGLGTAASPGNFLEKQMKGVTPDILKGAGCRVQTLASYSPVSITLYNLATVSLEIYYTLNKFGFIYSLGMGSTSYVGLTPVPST